MNNYCLAKLNFITAIHSGEGSLADSNHVFYADTLFSALCHEAILTGGQDRLNRFINMVQNNDMKFSDKFIYA